MKLGQLVKVIEEIKTEYRDKEVSQVIITNDGVKIVFKESFCLEKEWGK